MNSKQKNCPASGEVGHDSRAVGAPEPSIFEYTAEPQINQAQTSKKTSVFNRPGVSDETLIHAGIKVVTAEDALALCGLAMPGIWIPYHNCDGSPVLVKDKAYGRLRLDRPIDDMKYFQSPGTSSHVYIPYPFVESYNPAEALYLTEGEFKALALVHEGIPSVALPGFYGYANGELLPGLKSLLVRLRPSKIYFIGDNDTCLNYRFSLAAFKLAALLAPTPVLLPRLPLNGPKGIDDLKKTHCNEKWNASFKALIDAAVPVSGQTAESLCLKLFMEQIGCVKDLPADIRQKAEDRIGEIACFISKSPALFNELDKQLQSVLAIKSKQLQQLMRRAKKQMRDEIKNATVDKDTHGDGESASSTKLRAVLFSISQQQLPSEMKEKSMADAVLKCLSVCGCLYRHKEIRTFEQCLYFNNSQKRLLPLTGDEFESWLSYFTEINMSQKLYSYVHNAILVSALSGILTQEIIPERFWAARENVIYISNGDGQVVKVEPGNVSLADNGVDGVLFASGYTLAPWRLTAPKDPFVECRIFSDMKLVSPYGLDLLRTWCTALPANQQTKPPLVLTGPVGGGKTKTAVGVFELLGIFPRITKPQDAGEEGFWTSMDLGGVLCLDNADTKFPWLPDALAAAATDGKHEKRKLYTDSEIVRQQAKAALMVTSANPSFASDAGLADRLLVVRMERREETEDTSLTRDVLENRDAGLSWIAHTLAKVLADNDPVEKGLNKRHPDFADLAVKIGRAIGREQEVISSLKNAEADKSKFNLENDEIGLAIISLVESTGFFEGTAAELFDKLQRIEPAIAKRSTTQRLGKHLRAIWPHLQQVFEAECKPGHGGVNHYYIAKSGWNGWIEGGVSYCQRHSVTF